MMMSEGMFIGHIAWMLVMAAVFLIPFWRICSKAGFSGWLSLFMLIPLVNLLFLYFLAFSDWPTHKKLR